MPFKFNAITGKLDYFEAGSASTFTSLTDTPSSYSGQGGKFVKVNTGETGLEFGINWSTSGTGLYYTAGQVAVGHIPDLNNPFSVRSTVSDLGGNTNGEYFDPIRSVYTYKAVNAGGPYATAGSTIRARMVYGGGGSSPVGTAHAGSFQMKIYSSGDTQNEWAALFSAINHEGGNGGRIWGQDNTVTGPNASQGTQADLLTGATFCINNYQSDPIASGSQGIIIVSRPHGGAGTLETHTGDTSYPIDAGLAIVGWSGTDSKSLETNAFTTAVQIGGWASGWMSSGMTSKFGTGIKITDWTAYGINIPSRKSGGTGPSISVASGAGRAEFLSGIKVGNFTETASGGAMRYDSTNSFQGYHNGAWGALGGGVNAFDGGAFTDTYVATVNFDGGAF